MVTGKNKGGRRVAKQEGGGPHPEGEEEGLAAGRRWGWRRGAGALRGEEDGLAGQPD